MSKNQLKWLIGIAGILIALAVILMLALSGFELGGFWVRKGVYLG